MKAYLQNLLLPSADSIMSSFTRAVTALKAKADASSKLANQYAVKEAAASIEAERCTALAAKLSDAFTV